MAEQKTLEIKEKPYTVLPLKQGNDFLKLIGSARTPKKQLFYGGIKNTSQSYGYSRFFRLGDERYFIYYVMIDGVCHNYIGREHYVPGKKYKILQNLVSIPDIHMSKLIEAYEFKRGMIGSIGALLRVFERIVNNEIKLLPVDSLAVKKTKDAAVAIKQLYGKKLEIVKVTKESINVVMDYGKLSFDDGFHKYVVPMGKVSIRLMRDHNKYFSYQITRENGSFYRGPDPRDSQYVCPYGPANRGYCVSLCFGNGAHAFSEACKNSDWLTILCMIIDLIKNPDDNGGAYTTWYNLYYNTYVIKRQDDAAYNDDW